MSVSPVVQRLRITFGKYDALKWTGHLDIAKVWERVLRRARLPVLYTKGFNTRPRIALANALPLGITSDCELLDVMLREMIDLSDTDALIDRIQSVSPDGLRIYAIEDVPPLDPAMETRIRSGEYQITFVDGIDHDDLQRRIDDLLAQDQIVEVHVNRKGRKSAEDIRPHILSVAITDENILTAHLSVGQRGNLRPDKLVEKLGMGDHFIRMHRLKLHYI